MWGGRFADGPSAIMREINASIPFDYASFDDGVEEIEALPKHTPLAFLCRSGGRSQQAAEHFRALGFRELYNIAGGTNAWAEIDPAIPTY